MALVGRRNVSGPLLLLNLVMYTLMLGFAGWALNNTVGVGAGAGAVAPNFALVTALAGVLGVAAKVAAAYHARESWRSQGLASAASLATVAWAATALAFGLACKEMSGGAGGAERGWQMRTLEGLSVVLAFTQLLYVALLHAAVAAVDNDQPTCSLI